MNDDEGGEKMTTTNEARPRSLEDDLREATREHYAPDIAKMREVEAQVEVALAKSPGARAVAVMVDDLDAIMRLAELGAREVES